MDKISKFLKKLSLKDRERIAQLVLLILTDQLGTLDVKKLSGFTDLYRVRSGNSRIIFRKEEGVNILIDIGWRKDVYDKI